MKRLYIGIPTFRHWSARFGNSMVSMAIDMAEAENEEFKFHINNKACSTLAHGRQLIVDEALAWGATHLLFIDDDMVFPHNLWRKWLDLDVDVVAVNAVRKNQARPNFIAMDMKGQVMNSNKSTGLEQSTGLGTGIMMIKREVLEGMTKPHFAVVWAENRQKHIGEDFYFCAHAMKNGFKLWCDHDMSRLIGHEGSIVYSAGAVSND